MQAEATSLAGARAPSPAPLRILVAVAVTAALGATAADVHPVLVVGAIVAALVGAATYRALLQWRAMIGLIIATILFIPIRRYTLPVNLPFQLEPYRIIVMLVAGAWCASLLAEPAVRFRRTGLEGPLLLLLVAVGLSIAANSDRVVGLHLQTEVIKELSFFVTYLVVTYLIASVLTSWTLIDFVIKTLVVGGAVVAAAAIVESRTHYNVFNHLHTFFPILRLESTGVNFVLTYGSGSNRAYASAQHPIALGAALVMLIPFAVYLNRSSGRRLWLGAAAILTAGATAALARTSVTMLVAELIVFAILRPKQTRRLWPWVLPMLVVIHLAAPGALGQLESAFFPKKGVVAQQTAVAPGGYGNGRLADVGIGIKEWSHHPIFGEGYGTRISDRTDPRYNATLLDDQWLGILLETGIVGFLTLIWLFSRAVRRVWRRARQDQSPRGVLFVALAAAQVAYPVGMATFDSFSFVQVTFLVFIMFGIAAAALRLPAEGEPPQNACNAGDGVRPAGLTQLGAPAAA